MKIKKGFVLRDVAGRSVVVATGTAAKKLRGMIILNDTGKDIWQGLQMGKMKEEIIDHLVEDYEVSREKATEDVEKLIGQMQESGFLEE